MLLHRTVKRVLVGLVILVLVTLNIVSYYNTTETSHSITHTDLEKHEPTLLTPLTLLKNFTRTVSELSTTSPEFISIRESIPTVMWGSGPTQADRLLYLMNSYDFYKRRGHERGLMSRCVVTILRESGRANYGVDPALGVPNKFKLRPEFPDEYRISSDLALYTFTKGEFPAYDLMADRQKAGTTHITLTKEEEVVFESFYEEALNSLGIYPAKKPG